MPPAGRRAQAIYSFNQAAVLIVLISLAVMKAAPTHPALVNVDLGCRADFDYRLVQWSS
jgi:hypothetical protein